MKPTKVYSTDTDYVVCVYEGAKKAIVATCDPIDGTHKVEGRFSTLAEAITAAKKIVKQYKF